MELPGAHDVRVEAIGDDATYQLPARPLGILRLAGLLPLGFSVVWFSFLGKIIAPQILRLAHHPQPADYFIGALLLCFVAAGGVPLVLALRLMWGRCRIDWRNGHLRVSEQVGPFGWPRRMPRRPIAKFVVSGGGTGTGQRPLRGPFGQLAALSAKFENGVSRTLVIGYPRPWLEAIARDLSVRAGHVQATVAPPVEIGPGPAGPPVGGVVEKPAGSRVVLQRNNASVALEAPPDGFRQGSLGLLMMGLFWCGITGVPTVGFLFSKNFQPVMIPFLAVFWLVGLGLLAGAIHAARCRVRFTAGRSELTVVTSGPFGTKRRNFPRPDILDISVGPSRVAVNHRHPPELQVRQLSGKTTGFLMGRDPDELRWIAWELNQALGVTAAEPAPAPSPLPGFMDRPDVSAGVRPVGSPLGRMISLAICVGLALLFFWGFFPNTVRRLVSHVAPPPSAMTNRFLSNQPGSADPTLVFNAFGPGGTSRPGTVWAVEGQAHAEWFVPTLSGNLSEIVAAINPTDAGPHPGGATIFLARDRNGFPGRTLEWFSVRPEAATGLLTLESVKQPALEAGVKYWLCARSKGGWRWKFNDQNIVHNSARETGRGKWASAGDYCFVGAFSIRVSTNPPPEQPAPTAETNTNSPGDD